MSEVKKRGRKPKVKDEEPKEPKKRGRKPKVKDEEEPKEPKKRGRKPKVKIYSVSREPVVFNIENVSDNLLHLDKIRKNEMQIEDTSIKDVKTFEPYEQNANNFQSFNNIGCSSDTIVTKKSRDTFKKEKEEYKILPEIYDVDKWPIKTDIHCWWCCYEFEGVPIPYPVKIMKDKESGEDILQVKGCFCSFNCMKAWNGNGWALVSYLYKKMNKSDLNVVKIHSIIKKAPDRYLLDIFGGPLSIEKFRENFHNSINYELLPFPMIGQQQYMEKSNKMIEISRKDEKVAKKFEKDIQIHKEKKKDEPKFMKNTLEHLMSMQIK